MNTHDATRTNNPAKEEPPPATKPPPQTKRLPEPPAPAVDLDLAIVCFHDLFRADAARAVELLWSLLLDPITCEARCNWLTEASDSRAGRRLLPVGFLPEPREFLRELWWLATGQLRQAIDSGKADLDQLAQLASHPGALRLAHRAVMDGEDILAQLIKEHQVEGWNWLRDEVVSGRLQQHLGPGVTGRHVAVWRKEQPYDEFEVGDAPHAVRTAAAERGFVSEQFIAETFVDPF